MKPHSAASSLPETDIVDRCPRWARTILTLCLPALLLVSATSAQNTGQGRQQEEAVDYYRKWLDEDVVYIITDEERAVFSGLSTNEERERFIEQFWHRRDPDLRTSLNEFKEEHYRRIAYANERFASALPGWKTDRGRVYIIHGPPDEKLSRPTGGAYIRPLHEGGGTTGTYPFEIWYYHHLDGVGDGIELEFVDPTYTEEFRLAMRPEEKDAFLNVHGGYTRAEEMGLADKSERPYFRPANTALLRDYPFMFTRARDMPFQRYETYALVQRAPDLKYKDLQEIVKVNVTFSELPVTLRKDYFRLDGARVLVPITVEFSNEQLTYKEEGDVQVAQVAIYGIITSLEGRIVHEFEQDIRTSFPTRDREKGLQRRSMFQTIVPLEGRTRYKLDLVVKDLGSGKVGVKQEALIPGAVQVDRLTTSSLIVSNAIRPLAEIPDGDPMFVIGDVWVLPILSNTFFREEPLGIYLQVYGMAFDESTLEPSLRIRYQALKNGEPVAEYVDEEGVTIQFYSPRRVVLIGGVPVQELEPGNYQVRVEVTDRITGETVEVVDQIRLMGAYQVSAKQQ
jgi:GWxTD domain-containing protein